MSASIQLTLDGGLVQNEHLVTMRTLSRSMTSIQAAVDRAYLDIKYGQVFKHARLPVRNYPDADFLIDEVREGSFIIEFLSERGAPIVRRVINAIRNPYDEAVVGGELQAHQIARQIENVKALLAVDEDAAQPFADFINHPDPLAKRAYGDRSITKNVDHMLTPVRKVEDAVLKLSLRPTAREGAQMFEFTKESATRFSDIVSRRQLGGPVKFVGRLRALDRGRLKSNFKGKFTNHHNGKDLNLHIKTEDDYTELVPYLTQEEMTIIACPVIEYDAFDPNAGDIQFVSIVE